MRKSVEERAREKEQRMCTEGLVNVTALYGASSTAGGHVGGQWVSLPEARALGEKLRADMKLEQVRTGERMALQEEVIQGYTVALASLGVSHAD